MRVNRQGWFLFLIVAASLLLCGAVETSAQQRRRPSRRITNPVPPANEGRAATDAEIISTADETPAEAPPARGRAANRANVRAEQRASAPLSEQEQLRRTVNRLSAQVAKLSEDMGAFKQQQRALVDLERLTRAEQRADNLRSQLRTVIDRQFDLQARLDQLTYELQPDVIQQRTALVGSVRPELVRDALQRQLEGERSRVRQQLEQITNNRAQLERSIQTAETEIESLRARLYAESDSPQTGTSQPATVTPTPPAQEPAVDNTGTIHG